MGSNMAEAHPVGFQWVMEAKARGARRHPHRPAVHPHQRGGRPVRDRCAPGTDIAFLGGVINYILGNGLDFREYVTSYTNASSCSARTSRTPKTSTGCSAATTTRTASYDPSTWHYEATQPAAHGGGARSSPRPNSTAPAARS